ncbi:hypothetical protein APUTEX25_005747, partial [Auxenochlorella protothecoides]
ECGRGCLQVLTCGLMTYGKARPPPWSEPLLGPGAYPQSTHPADAPPKLQDMHGSPTKTDAYLRTHNILGRGHSDLEARYQLGRVLGRGADGVVREAVHLVKETRHACKTIYKGWLRRRSQVEGLRREVHILQHPWVTGQQSAEPLPPIVHERLKDFATMSRVRQVAMLVAEEQISKEMLPELYEVFFPPATSPDPAGAAVTCPGSRGLSPADIRAGLGRLGHELSVEESERMARTLGWGGGPRDRVPWRDFAVATLGWSAPGRAVFMRSLFDRLDSDASGLITLGKLARGLGEYGIDSEDVALVFSQADTDASGGIDFDEWSAFMAMNTRSLQEVVRHRIQATCGALGGH